jgi:hypothetical protein
MPASNGTLKGRMICVLTDTHFWVPVVVLIGGLILLAAIQ